MPSKLNVYLSQAAEELVNKLKEDGVNISLEFMTWLAQRYQGDSIHAKKLRHEAQRKNLLSIAHYANRTASATRGITDQMIMAKICKAEHDFLTLMFEEEKDENTKQIIKIQMDKIENLAKMRRSKETYENDKNRTNRLSGMGYRTSKKRRATKDRTGAKGHIQTEQRSEHGKISFGL